MLKLYTDESPGLKVDPVVVLVLSLGFIFSVVGLHGEFFWEVLVEWVDGLVLTGVVVVIAKVTRKMSS